MQLETKWNASLIFISIYIGLSNILFDECDVSKYTSLFIDEIHIISCTFDDIHILKFARHSG